MHELCIFDSNSPQLHFITFHHISYYAKPTLRHSHFIALLVGGGHKGILNGLTINLSSIVNVVNGLLFGGIRILNGRETADEGIDRIHT